MKDSTLSIHHTVHFSSRPQDVYEAYMDAKKQSECTGAETTSDPVIGGLMTAWDGYISAKNIELVPGKKIVQEWTTTDWPAGAGPSRLEITLEKDGKGTLLTMNHTLIPREGDADYDSGWYESYWEPMKKYFSSLK